MVAFNTKKKNSKQKSLQLNFQAKQKFLWHEDLPGGLRWLSKRPTWSNKGRRDGQIWNGETISIIVVTLADH